MAGKTKNDLIEEIKVLEEKLYECSQDLIKYEQIATCANMGEEYKLIYDNYLAAGFTKDQAFKLLEVTVERTVSDFMRDIRGNSRNRISYRRY